MAEILDPGQVRKGRFRTEIGDNRSLLRQTTGGYDLMKDGAQGLFRESVLVVFHQTSINLPFTQGVILGPLIF